MRKFKMLQIDANLWKICVSVILGLTYCQINADGQVSPSTTVQSSMPMSSTEHLSSSGIYSSMDISTTSTTGLVSTTSTTGTVSNNGPTLSSHVTSVSSSMTESQTTSQSGSGHSSAMASLTSSTTSLSNTVSPTMITGSQSFETTTTLSRTLSSSFIIPSHSTGSLFEPDSSSSSTFSLMAGSAASTTFASSTTSIGLHSISTRPEDRTEPLTNPDGEKDEHETMIMGLSIALGNAAAAIVCLLIAVAICRRRAHLKQIESDQNVNDIASVSVPGSMKTSSDETEKSETSSYHSTSKDTERLDLEDQNVYMGIVNPVHILYEENPDIVFV